MMPVIRISDDVMEILKKFAIPLEDTPDSVLRKILNDYARLKNQSELSPSNIPHEKGVTAGGQKLIPSSREKETRWIIDSLISLGGSAKAEMVTSHINKVFGREFSDRENELLPLGEPRWHKNVHWARYYMAKAGLLNDDAPHGVWELTEKGKTYY
ncbi:MAG: winged helix-turn-helix domain-containing protein [Desulfobaccales bacterium]